MNLSDWIVKHADLTPTKMAVRCGVRDLTYAAMAGDVSRLAAALKNTYQIGRGDRVALLGENTAQSLVLAFACARLGAIFQPLNWRQAAPEHTFVLNDSSPKVLFATSTFKDVIDGIIADIPPLAVIDLEDGGQSSWPSYQSLLEGAPEGFMGDPAVGIKDAFLLCYTSGTTGRPKGAVLSQNALFFNAKNSQHMHGLTSDDEVLVPLPLFHVGGLNILATPSLQVGATVHLTPSFDVDEIFDILEQRRITLTVMVPTQLSAMLASPRWPTSDLSALRSISTGSTLVPVPLIEKIQHKGIPVIQVYGSTETTPLATYQTAENSANSIGSGGKAGLHCEVKIVDEDDSEVKAGTSGEILVKGPNVLTEYWNDRQATTDALKDGWFYTGDIGHFDENGFIYIDDRKKDMIISGGENIYPAMLENILADCPGVRESAVVGKADEKWGEVAIAVISKDRGCDLDKDAVITHFDGRIGNFAVPRDVVFVEALPRNAMGKIVKDEVRALVRTIHEAGGDVP